MKHALPIVALLVAAPLSAQAGDREGEEQPPLPDDLVVPPAPALSAEDELATFALPEGYGIELVAAEPLVVDPVVAKFDPSGRLWVVEMRGYMPDVDGTDEDAPIGVIAVLDDTDGDGRMDRRTVFMDELVLPRAVEPFEDGALVIVPPDLMFARDTDGDGRADEFETIETGLGGIHSPEHAINGLLRGIDGWIECANWNVRYRRRNGVWERQRTNGGGQWGIAKDDEGRLFFNTNPDPLRGDRYSSHYAVRNANHGTASGVNVRVAHGAVPHPSRITPGVNRGYRPPTLGDDWKLAEYTAACSPLIYRGDALPKDARGNAFVCEPAGNLVARFRITEDERGVLDAVNAEPRGDFLTSTDERFRPVHLSNGPDGALYVVDLYRGILQHKLFVTTFLRRQIEERGLATPLGLGRIWRVTHSDVEVPEKPNLARADWDELGEALGDPNGWRRDAAQRIFVEEGRFDDDARDVLAFATKSRNPLERLHATWALYEQGSFDEEHAKRLVADEDQRVARAALRAAEPLLERGGSSAPGRDAILAAATENATDWRTRHQLILTATHDPRRDLVELAELVDLEDADMRAALLSGIAGREAKLLERHVLEAKSKPMSDGRRALLRALGRAVGRSGDSKAIDSVLTLLAENITVRPWEANEIARGLLDARPTGPDGKPANVAVSRQPAALDAIRVAVREAGDNAQVWSELPDAFVWPGKPGSNYRALTDEEEARFERGRSLYTSVCSACHQPDGRGNVQQAPPLRGSSWALGTIDRPVRIVLHGMSGPIEVKGRIFDLDMPSNQVTDEDLAAILTYVRREWGNRADPVSPEDVAAVRAEHADRATPWTAAELTAE